VQSPSGAVLVGGSGPGDWSVRELGTNQGGSLTDTVLLPLTGPLTNAGLTISQGLVRHLEADPGLLGGAQYLLFNHSIDANSGGDGPDDPGYGGVLTDPVTCAAGATCVRTADSNEYGTSYLAAASPTSTDLRELGVDSISTEVPATGVTLADAGPVYVVVDAASPAAQYVAEPGYGIVTDVGQVTGAALWGDTLWRATGPGQLQATDLDTMAKAAPVPTGSGCTATEVQATQRWLYWSCGAAGPAGVYDRQTRTELTVPPGPALLGDGFIVQHDQSAGALQLYDLHADVVSGPVTVASGVPSGPAPDDRNITWAVDKYSGDVAYVDAADSVHVISTGVPSVPVGVAYPAAGQLAALVSFGTNGAWQQGLMFNQPVAGWSVTIARRSTGQVVHTETGGPATGWIRVSWDGKLATGARAFSGQYSWSLAATPLGSHTPATVVTSTLTVGCGQLPYRSVDCDGAPALLAVAANGHARWYQGTASGRLASNGYNENWSICPAGQRRPKGCVSSILPFGDVNGDGLADLLARSGTGTLRAYLGIGQADFDPSGPSVKLGSGWNKYNALVAPGNQTAAGGAELLARDSSGRLWSYLANGHDTLRGRQLIGTGWGKYTRLIGAGDLNGDGIGDLLAVDSHGMMWVYYGNGHGGFGARHKVSSGWNAYTAIIGIGDLNNDGHNDVIARAKNGELWLFAGTGHRAFARPVSLHLNLKADKLF
jgi:hypothetical protein